MQYVGLDLHAKQSTFCVLDEHGQKVASRTVKGPWDKVLFSLTLVKKPFAVCFEASTGYGYLHERLGKMAERVVVAYVDDPGRFATSKSVGSYFGLVPCQDSSAATNRLGHITRQGPSTVRKLLTEAAWQGIRRSPRIRAYFLRVRRDDPERKKIALVATAHYLVRVMLAMLKSGECWREAPAA